MTRDLRICVIYLHHLIRVEIQVLNRGPVPASWFCYGLCSIADSLSFCVITFIVNQLSNRIHAKRDFARHIVHLSVAESKV